MAASIHDMAAFAQQATDRMDGAAVEEEVRELVRARAPLARERTDLPDDLRLGAGGLGLDSISLAELLLDCQRKFDIAPPVELLQGPPLTLGRLVACVRAAVSS
jgi:acyl carrier protein